MPQRFRQPQRYRGLPQHGGREETHCRGRVRVGVVPGQGLVLGTMMVVAHVVVEVEIPETSGRVVRVVVLPEGSRVHQPVRVGPGQETHQEQIQAKQDGNQISHRGKGREKGEQEEG